MFEESVVDSPNVIMKVTERGGADVKSAQVGDPLELHFEIFDAQSPYEIFVRDLVAKDGNDQSEIVLIDSRGCPAEGQILGPLVKSPETGKILISNFDAFKFPTSEVVQFRAHVTPCMPTCEPVDCIYDDYYGSGQQSSVSSYGRKKRDLSKRDAASDNNKVLVTNSFVVMDKFQQKNKNNEKAANYGPTSPAYSANQQRGQQPINNEFYTNRRQQPPSLAALPWTVPNMDQSPEFMNFNTDFHHQQQAKKETFKSMEEQSGNALCIDGTGIIVAIVTFLVLQIMIVVVWTQFWQKKKKRTMEKQDFVKQIFNPYSVQSRS